MINSFESFTKKHGGLTILLGIITALLVIIELGSFVADAVLLKYARQKLNTLSPYFSGNIRSVTTHPFAFSVDLKEIEIRQKAHPDRPIAVLRRIHAGIQWGPLFGGKLVADGGIYDPKLYVNVGNLKPVLDEMKKAPPSKVPWQEKLKQLPAVTVSGFKVVNGEISVVDLSLGPKPVEIMSIDADLRNIKDRPSAEAYPTDIRMKAVLAGGAISMNGEADLLAEPMPAVKTDFSLSGMDLIRFKDTAKLFSVDINKGTLSLNGKAEYSSKAKVVDIKSIVLDRPEINYIYVAQPEKIKPPPKKPTFFIEAQLIRIERGVFGLENKSGVSGYRLFVSDVNMELTNYSTGFSRGPAKLHLTGQFMKSGDTVMDGTFRPEQKGPDFSVSIAIKNTDMPAMNNLFRNYGDFDVERGLFSFYSQLTVKNNKVNGYVKPLFRDMKVYDRRTDKQKGEFQKLYEKVVGAVAHLLENPRKAVATKAPVSGTLPGPRLNTFDALVNIFQNAFIKSILPGFEKSIK